MFHSTEGTMLDTQGRLEAEIENLCKARDEYRAEKQELLERLSLIGTLVNSTLATEQSDVMAFGRDAWVYCRQHMKPHQTGWCSVGAHDKIGLGVKTADAAEKKCREWGFELYHDTH